MRKRLLYLNIIYAIIILVVFVFLDFDKPITTNLTVLAVLMATFIAFTYFYLNHLWFKHLDEVDFLIHDMTNEEKVSVFEHSKEDGIANIQYGLEELSEHIENMSLKYGYRKGQLEAILESLKLGLVAITQEGKVIFHNPKFSETYHLGQSIQGKSIYKNIYDKNLLDVLDESLSSEAYTLPNIVQSNGLVYSYYGLEIKSADERIGTLIVVEDVTKVHIVDKMKSDFVSNVTHELKTPLTSIRGFTETLKQVDAADLKTRNKFLNIIEDESERLSILINDILYLSEVESTTSKQKDDIDINRAIREVIELCEPNTSEDVSIVFEADKNYIIQFEQFKLKQMLINLISNSVKYTDSGEVRVSLSEDIDYVVLKVSDTGIGIPEKDQGRIFERFYRVDKGRSRLTGGTGLGLSIVKHIAERNDCQIHLDSVVGEGTTVTILIKK